MPDEPAARPAAGDPADTPAGSQAPPGRPVEQRLNGPGAGLMNAVRRAREGEPPPATSGPSRSLTFPSWWRTASTPPCSLPSRPGGSGSRFGPPPIPRLPVATGAASPSAASRRAWPEHAPRTSSAASKVSDQPAFAPAASVIAGACHASGLVAVSPRQSRAWRRSCSPSGVRVPALRWRGFAVDEGSTAGVFEPGELRVEDAWPEAECLGGRRSGSPDRPAASRRAPAGCARRSRIAAPTRHPYRSPWKARRHGPAGCRR